LLDLPLPVEIGADAIHHRARVVVVLARLQQQRARFEQFFQMHVGVAAIATHAFNQFFLQVINLAPQIAQAVVVDEPVQKLLVRLAGLTEPLCRVSAWH